MSIFGCTLFVFSSHFLMTNEDLYSQEKIQPFLNRMYALLAKMILVYIERFLRRVYGSDASTNFPFLHVVAVQCASSTYPNCL